jgi:ATP-dependent RNA helicase RhlE
MLFSDLNLTAPLLNALEEMGIQTPTTIQEKCYNIILSGKDVCGIAQTGTGKTLAYLLPCVRMMEYSKHRNPQMLVLVPTRELVMQVVEMAQALCKHRNLVITGVFGGVNMKPQADALRNGVDIVVATPGRLFDHILHGSFNPKFVKKLVIDEMDEMLQLGFRHQLVQIFEMVPDKRQNLLFSATIAPEINQLLDVYFNHPVYIEAAPVGTPLDNIKQYAYEVPNFLSKVNLLRYILDQAPKERIMIFTKSKKFADLLHEQLLPFYEEQLALIHSNKAQNQRFEAVTAFKEGRQNFLVATDIIARGIDIDGVDKVINFDLPDQAEHYIHRIGRTGRAQNRGVAISFIQEKDKAIQLLIEELMQMTIPVEEWPSDVFMEEELIPEETPVVLAKEINMAKPIKYEGGGAFHQKKAKNMKTPGKKTSYKQQMMEKYGKPKSRGAKPKKKR